MVLIRKKAIVTFEIDAVVLLPAIHEDDRTETSGEPSWHGLRKKDPRMSSIARARSLDQDLNTHLPAHGLEDKHVRLPSGAVEVAGKKYAGIVLANRVGPHRIIVGPSQMPVDYRGVEHGKSLIRACRAFHVALWRFSANAWDPFVVASRRVSRFACFAFPALRENRLAATKEPEEKLDLLRWRFRHR
jgi:hypothetical protein